MQISRLRLCSEVKVKNSCFTAAHPFSLFFLCCLLQPSRNTGFFYKRLQLTWSRKTVPLEFSHPLPSLLSPPVLPAFFRSFPPNFIRWPTFVLRQKSLPLWQTRREDGGGEEKAHKGTPFHWKPVNRSEVKC